MGNPLLEIHALGQSIWLDNISRELLDTGTLAQSDRRGRDQRRDLQPHHLREGHRPLGSLRPRAQRSRARRPRRSRDLLQARVRRHPRGRRPAAARVRRGRRPGRPHLVRAPAGARARPGQLGSRRQALLCRDRPPERVHQGAGDTRRRRRVPRADRGRRLGQRHAAVRGPALRGDRERLDRRPRASASPPASRSTGSPRSRASSSRASTARSTRGSSNSGTASCRASPPSRTPSSPTARSSSIFSGPRWEALAAKGAHVQRPLWASTSTKNPAYPDTLYVDTLIGPDTVNTMPEATIDATRDHGVAARTIDVKVDAAAEHMAELERLGVDLDRILAGRARRRGRGVVHEVVRLADHDDRRQGTRARTGPRMSMAAEVARLFARDASLWTDSGEDAWLGWIDAVEEGQLGLPELAGLGRPARGEPRAGRALRHGRLEPRPARDRRAQRQRSAARARLDRPRRRARRAGRGLALRDRVQVGLDDRAQLLRGRVLGARPAATARASSRSPIPGRRSRSGRAASAGRTSRMAAPTSAGATPRSRRSGSSRRCWPASTSRPCSRARPRRSRSATTTSASTRAGRSRP